MSRLLLYDTSNFIDFPIGGQLTSIGNFLRYLAEEHPGRVEEVLLVGVTQIPGEVGSIRPLSIHGGVFSFLPVAACGGDLAHTASSLRLRYAKGLLAHKKVLNIRKNDCNYIHTPEAFGVVKLCRHNTSCVIFSHGSYFNMERGFRFFQKNVLIKKAFVRYLKWLLKHADLIFVLDQDSRREYEAYNKNLVKAGNSIVCTESGGARPSRRKEGSTALLFVGRFSKDKRIGSIIQAARSMDETTLTIVGDGEEYEKLITYADERIFFAGAVAPEQVGAYMEQADMLVMNSAFEGIPMTILEALSHGLPVVSTDVGGIGEALRFGEDSEATDGTAEGIRAAVQRIEEHYARYSANAYENAKAFDYLAVNRRVYESLKQYWKEEFK